ncbi:hypothetical protein VHUM_01230 [Vanrija humicola]|uniref:Coenzyme Q-binding protein COQ10 START domain-containing protein n=1 Tax=Vanrija humicola TaxID=5417 RepID=A0A7D8Z1L9_VANHU|nr:hypothetical protein VHUM_01230 [Vanrija humicola]
MRVTTAALRPALVAAATVGQQQPSPAVFSAPSSARAFFSLPDITKLANLVPGAPEKGADGEEQRFSARKIMPYSPAQLYELVSDVGAYSAFIPFCTSSTVLNASGGPASGWKPGREPFAVEAELAVGFGGLQERYVSKVVGEPFVRVSATASERTPMFKNLETTWSFKPTTPAAPGQEATGPTLLSIDLVFVFANPLHRIASQAVLPKVAEKMVEAFEDRCVEVFGRR